METTNKKIPAGWKMINFNEFIELSYGSNLPKNKRQRGFMPVYGSNGVTDYHNEALVKGPGIIVGRKGSIGSVHWSESDFWPIDTTYYITEEKNKNLKWIYYKLQTLGLDKMNTASGIPGLNRNEVYSLKIAIPPLSEQTKIASILSKVDEEIEKVDQVINKTEELKKGLMQTLLTNGIGHKKFKKTELGMIPEEWEVKKLINFATLQRGFDLPAKSRTEGEFPLVSSNGITDTNNEFKVKGPGVITGRSGTIGKVFYVEKDFWPLNTTLYIKDFHGNYEKFVYYFLQKMNLKEFHSGTGVPTLNRNIVHKIKVAIPSLQEQKKITSILSQIDEQIEINKQFKHKLIQLKKSLMQDLLSGKVRVNK